VYGLVRELRDLCDANLEKTAPYVVRTRFERKLTELFVMVATQAGCPKPWGITKQAVTRVRRQLADTAPVSLALLEAVAYIHEEFIYLCDTSNWSNDGQDPRVEYLRPRILSLCDALESQENAV
jgi:hypothetical protein